MSFRTCGLWSAALTFTCTNACGGTIDRDYVNIAPGLGAVTGIQEPMESLKGKKTQVPLWQEVTDEWYSYIHRERLLPCCAQHLNVFLPLGDWKLTAEEVAFGTSKHPERKCVLLFFLML